MGIEVSLDASLKIGEIAAIFAAVAAFWYKLGKAESKFELIGEQQSREISALTANVEKLTVLVAEIAVTKQRLDNQGDRLNLIEKRYDELAHLRGFILDEPPPWLAKLITPGARAP